MQDIIGVVFEKSLTGGSFLYLLYMFTSKFNVTLESIAKTMNTMSYTLLSLDTRMGTLEARVHELEGKRIE
jgi:hypothetical protein